MVKNDNAHSVRLADSLERRVGNDTAREFEAGYPLPNNRLKYCKMEACYGYYL